MGEKTCVGRFSVDDLDDFWLLDDQISSEMLDATKHHAVHFKELGADARPGTPPAHSAQQAIAQVSKLKGLTQGDYAGLAHTPYPLSHNPLSPS